MLANGQTTTQVSVSTDNRQGNADSEWPSFSADGRWVAFTSDATNLVPSDANDSRDVFVHDRQTGATTRMSVATSGAEANDWSSAPSISANGRWVAFESYATNLIPPDTNGVRDVFVHDRETGNTKRVSVATDGGQANGESIGPSISGDGRWVAFTSFASNLVPGDYNGLGDVFVTDLESGSTTRVSVATGGRSVNDGPSSLPSISADGRWVAFVSLATLVPGDSNRTYDVFLHDRQTTRTSRVSVSTGGGDADSSSTTPSISGDGRWVAYVSLARNLVPGTKWHDRKVFVYDTQTGLNTLVSVAMDGSGQNGESWAPSISANGRWVAFQSLASNLVPADTNHAMDIFVHDRETGHATRVSVATDGAQANDYSARPSISGDGRWVAFGSTASNLVPGDTNGASDVFVHDRGVPACSLATAQTAAVLPVTGGSGRLVVLAGWECAWTAVSTDPIWLSITSGSSGTGFGAVEYYVSPNSGEPRTGKIVVEGTVLTVTQESLTTPMAPTDLVVHAVTGNVVTLRWNVPVANPVPTGFVLEGGVEPGQIVVSIPTTSLDPTFTFVAPSGSFYGRVHSVNGPYRSAASNEIRLHVNVPVAPSAPTNLLALVDGVNLALGWRPSYLGGTPSSFVLDVRGSLTTSLPLGFGDRFTLAGAPAGVYTLTVRAVNAGGSSHPSNEVTVSLPRPCEGPPLTPTDVFAFRVGRTVYVDWAPPPYGPAPISYVVDVIGAWNGTLQTTHRAISGAVAPGSYILSIAAVNWCGRSAGSAPQTIVVV